MIYKGENTQEIVFPLGGIGSGSIGLGGDGRLKDWEIFNRPNKGSKNGYSHFAIRAKTEEGIKVKVLNGDMIKDLSGQYSKTNFAGFGYGPDRQTMCGFPHFKNVEFKGEFPIAEINFEDDDFPGTVIMTAFNPFIPLDDKNSSIPAAFFEFEISNNSTEDIEYQLAFSVHGPFALCENKASKKKDIHMITMKNVGVDESDIKYGDLTVATDCDNVCLQTYWYRGNWQDGIVSYWNELNSQEGLKRREYDEPGKGATCTVAASVLINSGDRKKIRFVLSWNIPNNYNYWDECKDEDSNHKTWKNYYAVLFKDSAASAQYSLDNWDSLYERTFEFKNALFNSTLDEVVKDAASANLSVLKTATVMRLEDGSFYGWEGMHEKEGSCEGTCQHVWNYAYALCFLFPKLERSIRDLEFKYSTLPDGAMIFRLKLPVGRKEENAFRACVDGQMGSVIKWYREWKISGNDEWLKDNWENIKKILEYAWSSDNADEWDRDKDGVLEGRQHHTLDVELYGPSSWLEGMYLLALKAACEMAQYLGDYEKASEYGDLFEKGKQWTKEHLFNGEYFIHEVDIKDKSKIEHFDACEFYWNEEEQEIKYQIGQGSSIDQLLAQWHSNILGLGDIFEPEQIKIALSNMMRYNFKDKMRDFANPWRVFSINDESGAVICVYPENVQKPKIPIAYCEETMTGFEYSFAGLLISCGMIDEGIKVVSAIRDRYDGKKRNPWNEIECGSNYARSMASFALIPIFAGFEFDIPNKHIGFNPIEKKEEFKTFWSVESAWGSFEKNSKTAVLEIKEGELLLGSFGAKFAENVTKVIIDGKETEFNFTDGKIMFDKKSIRKSVEIYL